MNQAGYDNEPPIDASRASDADKVASGDTPAANDVVTGVVDAPTVVSDVPPHDDDPPSHSAGPPARTRPSSAAAGESRHRVALRSWKGIAVIVAVLVLGGAAGAAALAPTIIDKQDKISALKREKSSIQTKRDQLASKLNSRESKQHADEAASQRAYEERMTATAAQKTKDDANAQAAADQQQRDAAAAATAAAAKDTVDHDGVFEIGTDKNAGRYKTDGGPDCYYAILNSPDTSDIATNTLPGGPATVDLPPGKFFDTARCGVWKRVG